MTLENQEKKKITLVQWNILKGIERDKRQLKKRKKRKLKTYFHPFLEMNLFLFAIIPLFLIYDYFWESDTLIMIYGFIILTSWIVTLIVIFSFFLSYFSHAKNTKKLQCNTKYITIQQNENQTLTRSWQEIDCLIFMKKELIIIGSSKFRCLLPIEEETKQALEKYLENNHLEVLLLKKERESDKKKTIILWIKYLLLFLITGFIYGFLLEKNNQLLEEEIGEIKFSSSVSNENIETKGSNAKLEKEIKTYVKKYYEIKNAYDQINPLNFFENYSLNDLMYRKKRIKEYELNLKNHQDNSLKMLEEMKLLLEKETLQQVAIDHFEDQSDQDFFMEKISYILETDINYSWEEEKKKIEDKTPYLQILLTILLKEDASWYVEDEKIYFAREKDYQEYLTNYNLFHDFPTTYKSEKL